MKKKVLIGAAAGCAAAGCIAAAAKKDQTKTKPTMWDKMRQGMEEMPEDFPPRIMFDNIEATKANTEEILKLMSDESARRAGTEAQSTQEDDIELIPST